MASQFISRVRRNHGLEHATIHVMSEHYLDFSAQGNSDNRGFSLNVYGDITEGQVSTAVYEAHSRMKEGEHQLAVHPNCGTVLLTTATMATLAAQAAFSVEQHRRRNSKLRTLSLLFNALPSAILSVVVALIVSRPIGIHLQAKYTTEGDLGDMEIVEVKSVRPSPITRVFQLLLTGGNKKLQAKSYRIITVN